MKAGNALWPSLLVTMAFFAIYLGVLHPGYAINDDIKIIAIAAGYPGVEPSPFLIFSNILLGFVLVALYRMPSTVNWEIMLFLIVDAIALYSLVYVILSSAKPVFLRVLGAGLLLAGASYYPLRITFTSTAGLACFAGLLAILVGASKGGEARTMIALGIGLTFIGSLIRLEMLAIAAPLALVFAIMFHGAISWRLASIALGCAGALVLFGYGVDKLYVRANTDWRTFYAYTKAAQAVQDSHRLENMHAEIRRIGWSKNDQEVFARYFYPDAPTYSLEHLEFLVDRIPGTSRDPAYVLASFTQRLLGGRAGLGLLICLSAVLLLLSTGASSEAIWAVPLIAGAALAENLVLMWMYKSPDYVFLSTLSNAALASMIIPFLPTVPVRNTITWRGWPRMLILGALIASTAAIGLGVWQSQVESGENGANEVAYLQILHDVEQLRMDGSLDPDAIVMSASHGIPWHWANPLWLHLPSFAYIDTGWTTFSPYYEEVLRAHGLSPLPEALLTDSRLYWTSKPVFQVFLARYLEEHEGRTVTFETLYRMPDGQQADAERDVELYRVVPALPLTP